MSIDLKTLFNLPKQINLILPSKTKDGLDINLDLIIEEFLLKMTKIFGGCNIQNNITGAFKMQDGSIMIENNAIIEAPPIQNVMNKFSFGAFVIPVK